MEPALLQALEKAVIGAFSVIVIFVIFWAVKKFDNWYNKQNWRF